MKFSVILMSLTLPLAAQSAQAQESGSDTVNFLKSSISANESATPKKRAKLQLSDQRAEAQTVASSAIKLRPFVPNRKLPRQRDLDNQQLMAQTARMALPPPPLSGQISEFLTTNQPVPVPYEIDVNRVNRAIATYDAATLARAWAPRVMPGQTATIPGQVRVNRSARGKAARLSSNPEWFGQAQKGERVMGQSAGLLVQAPAMAPSEQTVRQSMAQLGYPTAAEIAQPASAAANIPEEIIRPAGVGEQQATAGPAPFPLNMLPQDQLKEFIAARARNRIDAPKAYFGSWHNPGGQNLASAGFHSNIHHSSSGSYSHLQPRMQIALAQKAAAAKAALPRPQMSQVAQVPRSQQVSQAPRGQMSSAMAQVRHSQPALQVATYAPYALQPHTGTD